MKNPEKTQSEIQITRNRLFNWGLIYLSIVVPLALGVSLFRIFTNGWLPVYFVHITMSMLIIISAILRNRLPYFIRASIVLLFFLVLGITGVLAFGLPGGGIVILAIFSILSAIAFGMKAGIISSFFSDFY